MGGGGGEHLLNPLLKSIPDTIYIYSILTLTGTITQYELMILLGSINLL